jgi:NADH dehydrogenase FAD-containing subunit
VLGTANHVDPSPSAKTVSWAGPEGAAGQVRYDRLILTAGSVDKLLPIPGLADYAHGFRSISEATYLRDHIIRRLELAADPAERAARCTFVVVGAGYTGTEVAAHGQRLTTRLARTLPGLAGQEIRWMLLDLAPRVLAELDRLAGPGHRAAVQAPRPGLPGGPRRAGRRRQPAARPAVRARVMSEAARREREAEPFPCLIIKPRPGDRGAGG